MKRDFMLGTVFSAALAVAVSAQSTPQSTPPDQKPQSTSPSSDQSRTSSSRSESNGQPECGSGVFGVVKWRLHPDRCVDVERIVVECHRHGGLNAW